MSEYTPWQFWIDRGGTFTDVVAQNPEGEIETAKLLSENPARYADAAAEGIRLALARWSAAGRPRVPVGALKMGTTVATNALLERRGSRTALVVTQGFADALAIGYQNRPDIFALEIVKPQPLYERVLEAKERVNAEGEVRVPLDEQDIAAALERCAADGFESVAVCLLHGWRWPRHEQRIAELARAAGFRQVSASHEVEPLVRFVSRAETTLVDAYLTPVLYRYIASLERALAAVEPPRRLLFMQSNGGLVMADRFRGKDSILSGPAAGVIGMVETARNAGLTRVIGFDMGGTSTDVSAWSGEYERETESSVGGVRLRAPMMKIHTIASGGGSLLRYRDGRYQVGPDSAGADPGPACYRRGGPLTITDANVLLGRIPVAWFPRVFGPGGNEPPDPARARTLFEALAATVSGQGARVSPEQAADGFLTVAVETMANAIRKITVERGDDVRDYTLCCFGGAGGQHACQVAEVLDIARVWLHPLAGVLSAYGMGLADMRVERQHSVEEPLAEDTPDALAATVARLRDECEAALAEQSVPAEYRRFEVRAGLRVQGSDAVLEVPFGAADAMRRELERAHLERFGIDASGSALVIATLRVEGTGIEQVFEEPQVAPGPHPAPEGRHVLWIDGRVLDVPVYRREALAANVVIRGPAIVVEANATTVIDPGWRGRVNQWGHLLLDREADARVAADRHRASLRRPDPVRLEVFNRLFMHVAEQMGSVLTHTALSVNIRERLDFSCALFDAEGRLVSNAPHMPVHLGSMGESVRRVIAAVGGELADGDAVMQNSPYNGGTHLPDITVVTPWFANASAPLFWLASRAHHADVGGITPGSMPATSTRIEQEGVLIDNFLLVRDGRFQADALRELFAASPWPPRNPAQNLADLKAQLAANRQGIRQLEKAIRRYGMETVQAYLGFVRENAATSVRRLIGRLGDGAFEYELDSGERIRVRVTIDSDARTATIDFAGTSPQSVSNFNAPEAVTRAAVLYVFRSLVGEDIPLNEGCLEPLRILIPPGSLLSPSWPAAVVAGNVETSQCVTDALYGALGALAASQGTMNNLSFGNARVQYYETIAGGAGAGPGWHGADAVQTHMTNSRMTDPEVLESRFPVYVESFAIRRGSGGAGRWRGGNGAVRRLRFREPVEVSVLSGHRRVAPFGLAGGAPGATGANRIEHPDGRTQALGPTATVGLDRDDCLVIETPGGGGYGPPG